MKLLVVEDDRTFAGLLRDALGAAVDGAELTVLEDLAAAQAYLAGATPDLVVLDIGLPLDASRAARGEVDPDAGLRLLEVLEALADPPRTVVLSGRDRAFAVRLLVQRRIHDYLFKDMPWDEVEGRLVAQLDVARERATARAARRELGRGDAVQLLGEAPGMVTLRDRARKVAAVTATCLIQGESGTGKELVARLVHQLGPRRDQPFVVVNCATLSEGLLESELFGHRKGAFTGAHEDRPGRFELADRGTLFLDEVGELPLALQPKLLRVLQEQTFERLGEGRTRRVDVRVVSATNRDLDAEVAAGRFRLDLMHRLRVVTLDLPALRDRADDIALLARHFLAVSSRKLGRPVPELTPAAAEVLAASPWPGNVRQLAHTLEAALIFQEGPALGIDDLSGGVVGPAPDSTQWSQPHAEALDAFERRYLTHHLKAHRGSTSLVAEAVGLPARTLRHRLQRLGLSAADFAGG